MAGDTSSRRAVIGAGLACIAGAAAAQTREFSSADRLRGRMMAPVWIGDAGPFAFAVDTAANTSVVARDIARRLSLPLAGAVTMHTLIGAERAETVRCPMIRSGALRQSNHRLAVAERVGLDGADGLLGTDLLSRFRLTLDFKGAARIERSRRDVYGFLDFRPPTARLRAAGDTRFGHLLTIDAWAGGARAKAIVDTGASLTIVNSALIRAAQARTVLTPEGFTTQRVRSPTGASATAGMAMLRNLSFSGVSLRNVPVLTGDFHTFALWGFADQPAMLLGVDVLGLFERVNVDLPRGEISLEL